MPKHPRYQDYVIKDGKHIGDYETLYQDYDDPWEQTTREQSISEKALVMHWCQRLLAEGKKNLLELGCGLGQFSHQLSEVGCNVLGVDVSATAVKKATASYPDCQFVVGDILDFDVFDRFKPDIIVMAEITWLVLEKLDEFLSIVKKKYPNAYFIHLLALYAGDQQKYGREYFSDLPSILKYFDMDYIESGEITYKKLDGNRRSFFLARTTFIADQENP